MGSFRAKWAVRGQILGRIRIASNPRGYWLTAYYWAVWAVFISKVENNRYIITIIIIVYEKYRTIRKKLPKLPI